ncbi:hypothetical protein HDU97_008707 [Phlyctochytrium planicorne]|nr:hypothetical protein HDU97_008707 [Phlyctochytrium planicorne]
MLTCLPLELLIPVLVLTGDACVAIKLESILLGLPHRYTSPVDCFQDLTLDQFPASSKLTQKSKWTSSRIPKTLCEVHWIIRFRPLLLMASRGLLWHQIASENRFKLFVAINGVKVKEGFPLKLMDRAVENGNIEAVKYLWEKNELQCSESALEGAARNGHLDMLKYLHSHTWIRMRGSTLASACKWGQLRIVHFLAKLMQLNSDCLVKAASNGHLDVIQFLASNMLEESLVAGVRDGMEVAALGGHHPVVRFLDLYYPNFYNEDTTALNAIKSGDLQVIDLLHRRGKISPNAEMVEEAINLGNVDVLRSMQAMSFHYSPNAVATAASKGRLDMIQFLCEEVKPDPPASLQYAIEAAAVGGHLPVVKYLCDRGILGRVSLDMVVESAGIEMVKHVHDFCHLTCSVAAMNRAAEKGYLDIVRFLDSRRFEGCTAAAMDGAARNGHLDVVMFLHERRTEGCTTAAMDGAASHGHLDIVRYLHERRTEGCTTAAMDGAAASGALEVVKFLHENRIEGCTTNAMDSAARLTDTRILKFLQENRSEGCTSSAMDNAADVGMVESIRFLHIHRKEGCTIAALQRASRNGHIEVVGYLHQNGLLEGLQMDKWCFSAVLGRGCIDIARYVLENGLVELDQRTLGELAFAGYLMDVKWVQEKAGLKVTQQDLMNLWKKHPLQRVEEVLGVSATMHSVMSLKGDDEVDGKRWWRKRSFGRLKLK